MPNFYVTLDQWRTLIAVVEQHGYAQAARYLNRSQSAISYAITRLQEQLGVEVLRIDGRKAVLTDIGHSMLQGARHLLRDAEKLENLARQHQQGWEVEITLVVDSAFPNPVLLQALKEFAPQDRGTRVIIQEVVLSGAVEALENGTADLVICAQLSESALTDPLIEIEFIAVAHPEHPLNQTGSALEQDDLLREMQVVIKDSGEDLKANFGWLESQHRWTVTSVDRAISTVSAGLGFSWLPRHQIQHLLDNGALKALPLTHGQTYRAHLYLGYGRPENTGAATQLLVKHLKKAIKENYPPLPLP